MSKHCIDVIKAKQNMFARLANYTRNEWKDVQATLETSGKDVQATLETSEKDVQATLETSVENETVN